MKLKTQTLPRPYESPSALEVSLENEDSFCASTGSLTDFDREELDDEFGN